MKLTIETPDDTIRAAIGGAGISYWCNLARSFDWEPETMSLSITEIADGRNTLIEREHFTRALEIMAAKYPGAIAALRSGAYGARTGDLLVQLAAFGERKYA